MRVAKVAPTGLCRRHAPQRIGNSNALRSVLRAADLRRDGREHQVGAIKVLKTYQAIEANIGGAAGTDLSGVDITDDRAVDHAGDSASEDRRTDCGRLFENPWSEKNWVPATAPAEEAETRAEDDAVKQEPGGALDPL